MSQLFTAIGIHFSQKSAGHLAVLFHVWVMFRSAPCVLFWDAGLKDINYLRCFLHIVDRSFSVIQQKYMMSKI